MASYKDFLPAVQSGGGWQRPSDWLALPTVTVAEQKFVGLHAVFPEGNNFCALLFRGAYTVDWGDGVVEDVADNVKAEHEYDYAAISNSTLTSRGYKQVIVTVTPQGAGNLTSINFQQRYTGQNQAYATGWLDVTGSFPNAGSGATITFGGSTVRQTYVEQVTWVTIGGVTNCNSMFNSCYSLQSVSLFDTASVTTMVSMFANCFLLQSVPLFNTASVTNSMTSMFFNCPSLQSVPLFNTANVTNMSTMFLSCSSLQSVPLFDTASVTSMASMFQSCTSLQSVPLFDTASVLDMSNLFNSCQVLQSVPLFDTALVTTMVNLFSSCLSLNAIPALSTASITTSSGADFAAAFASSCNSLDRCQMVFARTVGFANAQMGTTALVEIFNNLVDRSATTSATITITNNWGAALLTAGERAIASSKNWTITG
jgi:surface protein